MFGVARGSQAGGLWVHQGAKHEAQRNKGAADTTTVSTRSNADWEPSSKTTETVKSYPNRTAVFRELLLEIIF